MPSLPTSSSYDDFGGPIQDYSMLEDASTQWSANEANPLRASAAAMTNTCFRVSMKFYIDGYQTPQISAFNAVWNTVSSALPTITYTSAGNYVMNLPSTVTDLQGNTQSVNILGGIANVDCNNGNGWFVTIQTVSSTQVNIFVWSAVDGQLEDIGTGPTNTIDLFLR